MLKLTVVIVMEDYQLNTTDLILSNYTDPAPKDDLSINLIIEGAILAAAGGVLLAFYIIRRQLMKPSACSNFPISSFPPHVGPKSLTKTRFGRDKNILLSPDQA